MRPPVESFRQSFWWLLLYVILAQTALAVPLALALTLGFGMKPPPGVVLSAVIFGVGAGEIFSFLGVFFLVLYYRVHVSPEGLRCFNFWGTYRTVAWSDVVAARPLNFLGLEYVRIFTSAGGSPLWLPLFLAEPAKFHALVCRYAGAAHPLAVALHEKWG